MASKSSLPTPETLTTQTMTAADIYKSVFTEYPDVLSVPHVVELLGVSVKTTYRLLNNGTIKSLKIGREFKVPKLYLMQYLNLLSRNEQVD